MKIHRILVPLGIAITAYQGFIFVLAASSPIPTAVKAALLVHSEGNGGFRLDFPHDAPNETPWMRVNYAEDWVGGNYPTGHTIVFAVTDDLGGVKAIGSANSTPDGGWNGPGFISEVWEPEHPDIVPGDWVEFSADDGFTKIIQMGEINLTVDWAADFVAGGLSVPWITEPIPVRCELWGHPDLPGIDVLVEPTGGPFECNFGGSGHDIAPGQTVVVMYWEPDGDLVMNADRLPHMVAHIGPWSGGDRHVWGSWAGQNAAVHLVVEDDLGGFIADTVVQADSRGYFDSGDNFPPGTLAPWNNLELDSGIGITSTLDILPMEGQADVNTDVVTVTAAGSPFFTVFLEFCDLEICSGFDMGEIGLSGIVSANLGSEGWDIQEGQSFHAHLRVGNGHEIIYSWGIPITLFLPLIVR